MFKISILDKSLEFFNFTKMASLSTIESCQMTTNDDNNFYNFFAASDKMTFHFQWLVFQLCIKSISGQCHISYPSRNILHIDSFVASTHASDGAPISADTLQSLQWVIMSEMVSQITSVSIVCSTVWSGSDHRKHRKFRVTGLCDRWSPLTKG